MLQEDRERRIRYRDEVASKDKVASYVITMAVNQELVGPHDRIEGASSPTDISKVTEIQNESMQDVYLSLPAPPLGRPDEKWKRQSLARKSATSSGSQRSLLGSS